MTGRRQLGQTLPESLSGTPPQGLQQGLGRNDIPNVMGGRK
jgi:hypothetical protein